MHTGLHSTLKHALHHGDQLANQSAASTGALEQVADAGFTDETALVGRMYLQDFERFGVHLDKQRQQQLADLTLDLHKAGFSFGTRTSLMLLPGTTCCTLCSIFY